MNNKSMTRKEKEKLILKVWEKMLKGNPNTVPSWQINPKSFIRWSLKKVRNERYNLYVLNTKHKDILLPYNLIWKEKPTRKRRTQKDTNDSEG